MLDRSAPAPNGSAQMAASGQAVLAQPPQMAVPGMAPSGMEDTSTAAPGQRSHPMASGAGADTKLGPGLADDATGDKPASVTGPLRGGDPPARPAAPDLSSRRR